MGMAQQDSSRIRTSPSRSEPFQQRRPVVLVAADLLGAVIEQAPAEPDHQHIGLGVAQLRHHRIGPGLELLHGLLRGVGPGLEPVADQRRPAACPSARAACLASELRKRTVASRSMVEGSTGTTHGVGAVEEGVQIVAPWRRRRHRSPPRSASAGSCFSQPLAGCRRSAARRCPAPARFSAQRVDGAAAGRRPPARCACRPARNARPGWWPGWSCPRRPWSWRPEPSACALSLQGSQVHRTCEAARETGTSPAGRVRRIPPAGYAFAIVRGPRRTRTAMSELQDLTALIRANTPLIVIETPDEARVVDLFRHVLDQRLARAVPLVDHRGPAPRRPRPRGRGRRPRPTSAATLQAIKQRTTSAASTCCSTSMPYLGYASTQRSCARSCERRGCLEHTRGAGRQQDRAAAGAGGAGGALHAAPARRERAAEDGARRSRALPARERRPPRRGRRATRWRRSCATCAAWR